MSNLCRWSNKTVLQLIEQRVASVLLKLFDSLSNTVKNVEKINSYLYFYPNSVRIENQTLPSLK